MINLKVIAHAHTPFDEKFGVPRQSGLAPKAKGIIKFNAPYDREEAFSGLEDFSHLWLIFIFDQNPSNDNLSVRPPRLGGNKKRGVFATRSSYRPNSLGLSLVKLEEIKINQGKVELVVSGIDLVSGTSIVDIKPYLPQTEAISNAKDLFTSHNQFKTLEAPEFLVEIPSDLKEILCDIFIHDPRPAYDEDQDKTYGMLVMGYNIRFKIIANKAIIEEVRE